MLIILILIKVLHEGSNNSKKKGTKRRHKTSSFFFNKILYHPHSFPDELTPHYIVPPFNINFLSHVTTHTKKKKKDERVRSRNRPSRFLIEQHALKEKSPIG